MPERGISVTVGASVGGVRMTVGSAAPEPVEVQVQGGGTLDLTAQRAERLATARQIALGGDALGRASFDGSEDVTICTAIERLTNEELEAMLT